MKQTFFKILLVLDLLRLSIISVSSFLINRIYTDFHEIIVFLVLVAGLIALGIKPLESSIVSLAYVLIYGYLMIKGSEPKISGEVK